MSDCAAPYAERDLTWNDVAVQTWMVIIGVVMLAPSVGAVIFEKRGR
ncbi:hypothetical protein [Streptomyces hydrogenans]